MNCLIKRIGGMSIAGLTSATLTSWLLFSSNPTRADVAYENNSQPYDQFYPDLREFGDEINLGAPGRTVTKFEFEYFGFFTDNGTQFLQVRFYANDGEGSDSTAGNFGNPNTVLYESDVLPMTSGYNVVTLSNLSVEVGGRFTWTVQFSGVTQKYLDSAGLTIYNPPNIGSSYDDFWLKSATGWEPLHFPNGNPCANFSARVETSPDTSLAITSQETQDDGSIALTLAGPAYSEAALETALDSDTNQWTRLRSFLFTGAPILWTDPTADGATNRLYRLTSVDGPFLQLGAPEIADGNTLLPLTGTPGKTVVIDGSDDLVNWTRVKTNYFASGQYTISDNHASTHTNRFYRGWFANDVPITMLSSKRIANGMVLLVLSGPPGKECMVESSVDLKAWNAEGARTFSFTGGTVNYLDTGAPMLYFRNPVQQPGLLQ